MEFSASPPTVSHILGEDSELAEAVAPADRARAIEDCVAKTIELERGAWAPDHEPGSGGGIGLLVQQGLLIRQVGIDGRAGAELLGEGDILRPWQGEDGAPTLRPITGWHVLRATRLAVLDSDAARLLASYPELTGQLVARALQRSRNLTVNMAIVHHARVSTRLQMLLWHLADRWGRVRVDGVLLPFRLTHEVLSDLVAARRPTVSSALSELTRNGRLRLEHDGWILTGEPPGELLEIQDIEPRR